MKVRIKNDADPMDFFNLYTTPEIIELFVIETNWYAQQYIALKGDTIKEHSNVKNWKETDTHEMRTFLGVLLLMGIVYKPRMTLYWSTDEIFSTPIFSQVISRNRFFLLLKFLHFSNNDDPSFDPKDENRDRLHKVRPLINMIRQRCKKIYYPGKNLSVDESLVLFKGRLAFKQYIKTKRAHFGIKLYELCSSNGVTLDFFVYCGKGFFDDENDEEHKDFSVTEKIPAKLMSGYYGNGHCVFVDNFYTSPKLAEYMLDNNTYLCGTINRKRCNYSKEIVLEELEKGAAVFYKSGELLACKYRAIKNKSNNQPKIVYTLSTAHPASMESTGKEDKDGNPINKPSMILEYNHQMGGVDRVDQQLHAYHTLRKTYKWYRKLALRLIMQCILNSHKVYQKHTGSKDDLLSFMHNVVACLLVSSPRLNKEICLKDTVHRLTGRHFPMKKKPNPGTKDPNPTKNCRVCYARGVKTNKGAPLKTVFVCKTCPSQPGPQTEDCLEIYHTILDYSA